MNKIQIRQKLLENRKEMSSIEAQEKSAQINERLKNLPELQNSKHALFYYSVNNEVSTHELIKESIKDRSTYLPKIFSDHIFKPVKVNSLNELKKGLEGILEPKGEPSIDVDLDLIIIPGVGFDLSGGRMGMGKGYYDRFLPKYPSALKIALAYEVQILDSIPKEPYDVDVDMIITEKDIYYCK